MSERFFGSYQDVSGNDWWGDRHAPWNQPDAVYETCSHCNGDGGVWYDDDGNEYTKADYERLSEECRKGLNFDKCEHCDGVGTIEVEPYTPDYDDFD